jgi:uncharacterized protein
MTACRDLDWDTIGSDLDTEGYALLPNLIDAGEAKRLTVLFAAKGASTAYEHDEIVVEREVSSSLEVHIAQILLIARRWTDTLGLDQQISARPRRLVTRLNRLQQSEFVPMHHGGGKPGEAFPLQFVVLLSEPQRDFRGGELVMTEQRPRMQSRPMVLPLRQGYGALVATGYRPVQGSKGPYRVTTKHAIAEVSRGERIGLDLNFVENSRLE